MEELNGKRKELDVRGDRIEREKEGWKRKVEGGEKTVLERLERAEREKEESGRMKAKMEVSEREKDEKRQTKDETHRATTVRIDALTTSIAKQLTRLQQAEKDAVDASRFRQLARQYEADVKEAARYKLLVKQGRQREKIMEKEVKELSHWRQRAKAFEREVRQLRSWRREVGRRERRAEGLDGTGWGMTGIPTFDYLGEGGLDPLGYDGLDEWPADGGLALPDDPALRGGEGEEDEAAIPPIDVITSQALSQGGGTGGSGSSRGSYTLSGSTLQVTAAPFVPRQTLPVAGQAALAGATFASAGLYSSYPAWGTQGYMGMGEAALEGARAEGSGEPAEAASLLPR